MNEEDKKPDLMKIAEEEPLQTKKKDQIAFRKRMLLIMGAIVGILIVILVILIIVQLFSKKTLSYDELEAKLKDSAISYYKVQKDLLPKEEGEKVLVDSATLSAGEYMKPIGEYLPEGTSCKGEVSVQKVKKRYVYTPYLDCGDKYQTKELYKAVLEQNVVTSGYGLYQIGEEHIYRGEEVNNYIEFANTLWRIVKVTADNQVVITVTDEKLTPALEWDNRYNDQEKSKTGINVFHVSRIKEALDLYTKEATDDTVTFTESDLDKLATFNLCVGGKSEESTVHDNSEECALVEENQLIGLLTVSDYMNASTDAACQKALDRSCQNYNYLKFTKSFWLANPNTKNTRHVYSVSFSGYITTQEAIATNRLRPVVHLADTVMIKSGDGTKEKPFELK